MKRIYGLIGYPLGHSFSHAFFNKKFAEEGIDAVYKNFEIADIGKVRQLVASTPGLSGLNVTIPYKEQVMGFLDAIDPQASEIGAVNVVKVERAADGGAARLTGFNSDIAGFCESIKPLLKPWHKRALVLGTGGASKAVVHGLRLLGVEPTYVSRTAAAGRLAYSDLTKEVMAKHTVVVNATPVGMYPHVDECPAIPYSFLTPAHLCYDLVYNPEVTAFLAKSAEQGAATKNGLEMLHLQALAAWDIWNSEK